MSNEDLKILEKQFGKDIERITLEDIEKIDENALSIFLKNFDEISNIIKDEKIIDALSISIILTSILKRRDDLINFLNSHTKEEIEKKFNEIIEMEEENNPYLLIPFMLEISKEGSPSCGGKDFYYLQLNVKKILFLLNILTLNQSQYQFIMDIIGMCTEIRDNYFEKAKVDFYDSELKKMSEEVLEKTRKFLKEKM